jgi:hypothetical protein
MVPLIMDKNNPVSFEQQKMVKTNEAVGQKMRDPVWELEKEMLNFEDGKDVLKINCQRNQSLTG